MQVRIAASFRHTALSRCTVPPARGARRMREPASAVAADGTSSGSSQEQQPAAAGAGAAAAAAGAAAAPHPVFTVLSEQVIHKRYLTLYNRTVQFPSSDGVLEVGACSCCSAADLGTHRLPPAACSPPPCVPCPAGPCARVRHCWPPPVRLPLCCSLSLPLGRCNRHPDPRVCTGGRGSGRAGRRWQHQEHQLQEQA